MNPEPGDPASPEQADLWAEGGVTRLSLGLQTLDERWLADVLGRGHTAADFARATVLAADAGLEITLDRVGNVRARRPGLDDSLAPVVIGSHVDSVATAGRFDGCLGVLGGLEVVRTLNDHEVSTLRPI